MPNQSWFFASGGQQQGPYPEAQLRDFITGGTVTADTLVWTEGMADWRKAGEIPGLLSGASVPPAVSQADGRPGDLSANTGGQDGRPLSLDFGIWDFTWRSLVLFLSMLFVIPLPWALVMYMKWIVSCVRVPQRPNLTFDGRAVDLMWVYAAAALFIAASWTQSQALNFALSVVEFLLTWLLIKWFFANLGLDGQSAGLRFSGSAWGFLGWSLLAVVSLITIIGWAWVYVAQIRWMCRHIEGTRREVVFNGTGLAFLWRAVVIFFPCLLIIPIPWMYRWFNGWLLSQTVLVERTTQARA